MKRLSVIATIAALALIVTLASDFFSLAPGDVSLAFSGCSSLETMHAARGFSAWVYFFANSIVDEER